MLGHMRRNGFFRKVSLAALAAWTGAGNAPLLAADCNQCGGAGGPSCPVNARFFGYYPTKWRHWPGTEAAETQPAPTPTELQNVPLVEPPKPSDEVPPPKTPGAETSPGATTPDTAPSELPAPGGAGPGGAGQPKAGGGPAAGSGATQPQPDSQRYVPRSNSPESLTHSAPPAANAAVLLSPDWPPTNTLRGADMRANFQTADGVTLPALQPARSPIVAQPPVTPSPMTTSTKPATDAGNATVPALNFDREAFVGAKQSPAALPSNPPAPVATTRMPLLPSNVWNNPPPPLDAAIVSQATTGGAGPDEASIFALAPPTRVTDIGVPTSPSGVQSQRVAGANWPLPAVASPPQTGPKLAAPGSRTTDTAKSNGAPADGQSPELLQIDPLAIGRSLSGDYAAPPPLPVAPMNATPSFGSPGARMAQAMAAAPASHAQPSSFAPMANRFSTADQRVTDIPPPATPVTAIDPLRVDQPTDVPLAGLAARPAAAADPLPSYAPPVNVAPKATAMGSDAAVAPSGHPATTNFAADRDEVKPLRPQWQEPRARDFAASSPASTQSPAAWATDGARVAQPAPALTAPAKPSNLAAWQPPASLPLQAAVPASNEIQRPPAPPIQSQPIATDGWASAGAVMASDDAPVGRVQAAAFAAQESTAPLLSRSNPLRTSSGANARRPEFSAADWSEMPATFTESGWANPLRERQ